MKSETSPKAGTKESATAQSLRLSSFLSRKPWVLVPNGSLHGFFDFVPEHLRIGPWKPSAPIILLLLAFVIAHYAPSTENQSKSKSELASTLTLVSNYHNAFSPSWYYNLLTFTLMTSILTWICFYSRKDSNGKRTGTKGAVVTYTILSWILNSVRHGINALAPFLTDHHVLLKLNRIIRFPALISATITFVIWNFALLPIIYLGAKKTGGGSKFLLWNLEFVMVQIHLCNIFYSFLNTVVTGRSDDMVQSGAFHLFDSEDLWYGLTYGYLYGLFYTLVLDRIGVHIYPIFSPRSNLVAFTWAGVFALHYAFYKMWNHVMESSLMDVLSLPILVGACLIITAATSLATIITSKLKTSA